MTDHDRGEFDPPPKPLPRRGPGWYKGRCIACGLEPTDAGHDPCIPALPGVRFACCGHGWDGGYIATADGRVFRTPDGAAWKPTYERYLVWLRTPQGQMVAEMGPETWRALGWFRLMWGRQRHIRCSQVGAECRCPWSKPKRLDEMDDDDD